MNVQPNTTVHRFACDVNRSGRIVWLCEVCNKPIRAKTGYLTVDRERAMRQNSDAEEREYRRKADALAKGERLVVIFASEMLEWPGAVKWQALHLDCDPDLEPGLAHEVRRPVKHFCQRVGALDVEPIVTITLEETDWDSVLRRVAAAAGGADA